VIHFHQPETTNAWHHRAMMGNPRMKNNSLARLSSLGSEAGKASRNDYLLCGFLALAILFAFAFAHSVFVGLPALPCTRALAIALKRTSSLYGYLLEAE
jgi:hypothetical protein